MRFKRISNWIYRVRTRLPHAVHSSHLTPPPPTPLSVIACKSHDTALVASHNGKRALRLCVCVCVCAGLSQLQGWQIWLNYSAIAKRFIFRPGAQLHFAAACGVSRHVRRLTQLIVFAALAAVVAPFRWGMVHTRADTEAVPLTQSQWQSQTRRAGTPSHQSEVRALHGMPSIRLHLSIRQRSARWRCK